MRSYPMTGVYTTKLIKERWQLVHSGKRGELVWEKAKGKKEGKKEGKDREKEKGKGACLVGGPPPKKKKNTSHANVRQAREKNKGMDSVEKLCLKESEGGCCC